MPQVNRSAGLEIERSSRPDETELMIADEYLEGVMKESGRL